MEGRPSRPTDRISRYIALLALTVFAAACGIDSNDSQATTARPTAWVFADATSAVFLRWAEDSDGRFEGALQVTRLQTDVVAADTYSVSGLRDAGGLTLTIDGLLAGDPTITGEIDQQTLTLFWPGDGGTLVPLVLTPGSVEDYNAAVSRLSGEASVNAEAIRLAEAEAAALHAAERELEQAREDLEVAIGEVRAARDWVGYGLDDLSAWVESLRGDVASLEQAVANEPDYVQDDLATVESTYQGLVDQVTYARGPDSLGWTERALAGLPVAAERLLESIQQVRDTEDLYLADAAPRTRFADEEALIEEARELVDTAGPAAIAEIIARIDQLEAEARTLMDHARDLAS
jgi:hypothetical protein